MEIGRDWDPLYKNKWPQEKDCPEFKSTMIDFFKVRRLSGQRKHVLIRLLAKTCHELHVCVMRTIALGFDLEESFFDDKIGDQYHNLRLLSYPPIKTEILRQEGQARAGAHSGDFDILCICI